MLRVLLKVSSYIMYNNENHQPLKIKTNIFFVSLNIATANILYITMHTACGIYYCITKEVLKLLRWV